MYLVCPKNNRHRKFSTTAKELHDWIVDEEGNFVDDLGCRDVIGKLGMKDEYECSLYGTKAVVLDEKPKKVGVPRRRTGKRRK